MQLIDEYMIELNHLDLVKIFDQDFVLLIEVIHRMELFLLTNMLDQHLINKKIIFVFYAVIKFYLHVI